MFPAYAGVIPKVIEVPREYGSVPRASGGDPGTWGELWVDDEVFPAQAGVIL